MMLRIGTDPRFNNIVENNISLSPTSLPHKKGREEFLIEN